MKKSFLLYSTVIVMLCAQHMLAQGGTVHFRLPDSLGKRGVIYTYPIYCDDVLSAADSVVSGEFSFAPNSLVTLIGFDTSGTMTGGIQSVSYFGPTKTINFTHTVPITGSGVFMYLQLYVSVAAPPSVTDSIDLTGFMINAGLPSVLLQKGSFRAMDIFITPKNPPQNRPVGDTIQFNVFGDVHPPLFWTVGDTALAHISNTGKATLKKAGQTYAKVTDAFGLQDVSGVFQISGAALPPVTVGVRDTSFLQTKTFDLPIRLSDVTSRGIISAQWKLNFNPNTLIFKSVITAGTMTQPWGPPTVNPGTSSIDVAMAGADTLTGNGILAYVRFQVKRHAVTGSDLDLQNVLFNEDIIPSIVDGFFTPISGPFIAIVPGVQMITKGDTITYGAIGGTPPYKWYSSDTNIADVDSLTGKVTSKLRGSFILSAYDQQDFDGSIVVAVNDLTAAFPDTIVRIADSVDVPLSISDVTGLGIQSVKFKFAYDTSRVRFSIPVTGGTLSSGMTTSVLDSGIFVTVNLSGAVAVSGNGILTKLRFHHKAPTGPGQVTPLGLMEFLSNGGGVGQPTATLKSGKIMIAPALNKLPQFTSVMNDTTIDENQKLTFDYNAFDQDLDPITFSLVNAAPGMTIDVNTGLFSWTPTFAQSGAKTFTVVAADNKGGVTTKATLVSVNDINRVPLFLRTMNDTTIQEQQLLIFDVDAVDLDGGTVKYSLVNPSAGMKLDSITGTFTWTPTRSQSGVHQFIIRASEIPGSISDDPVMITVLNQNEPPVFTKVLNDTTINEDQQLGFDIDAIDPDNDPIRYFIQNAPLGLSLDSLSGVLVWRPTFNQSGLFNFTLGTKDINGAAALKQIALTVKNVNREPVFTKTLPETTFTEPGLQSNFVYAGQDPDNDVLTFTGIELPSGAQITSTGQFSWMPTFGQIGMHRIVVKMSDGSAGLFDTAYFSVTLKNTPPVFTSVPNDTTISEIQTLSLTYTAADSENDTLAFSLVQPAPFGLSVSKNGVLTWTPDHSQSGIYSVVVALNERQFTLFDTVKITVLNVNRPPQFISVLPDLFTFVDSTLFFKYSANDPDNDALTFTLMKAPVGASLQSNGSFSWKPTATDLGKDTFIVRLSDGTVSIADTAVLTVNGFPFAEVSQTNFDFGSVIFGGTKTLKAVVRNRGVTPLFFHTLSQTNISLVNLPPDPNFILDTAGTSVIPAGGSDTISFTYLPRSVGGHGTGIVFLTNDPRSPLFTFILNGTSISTLVVKKKMMVDIQHNSTLPLTDTANGMGVLFKFLAESGIQVSYSGQLLQPSGNDVLLIAAPQRNYARAEIDSIANFVKNGGLLIAFGNSAQDGSNDALNSLLKDTVWNTGLSLNNNVVVDSTSSYFTPFAPLVTTFADTKHPFLSNVDTLVFFGSGSINISGTAIPFATTSPKGSTIGLPVIAQPVLIGLTKIGKGKLLLTGDADAWRVDSQSDSLPPNISAKDNLAFVLNVLSVTEDYEVVMPAKTPNEQYRLVSIPYDLENGEIKSVLKGLGEPNPLIWRLFGRYDPLTTKYAEFPSDKFNSFKRGEAYWLITRGEFDLTPGTATIVPVQNYYPVKIGPGYSIVGNPFPYRVSWKNSFHDSVQNVIWGFDGTTFKAESLSMAPFTGYFVKNLSKDSVTLFINPQDITDLKKNGLARNSSIASAMSDGEWRVGIAARSGKVSDADNYAGVKPGADAEYDANDVSEPPPTPTDYVIVRFTNREWKRQPGTYAVDIRSADQEGLFWDIEVITAKAQSNVTLSLDRFGALPDNFSLYLFDKTTERAIPLNGAYQYQFTMMKNETRRNFRLVAGTSSFVEQHAEGIPLVAMEYELMQNYPNPFNPSTNIRYTLGHSGHVTLDIYNVLGQRVRSLRNEFQPIGTYSAEWDGRNDSGLPLSTGVYLYRVRVSSNNETVFTRTNKMILMK